MSEFVLKTKEQEVEAKVPDVQFDQLPDELVGAVRAEGEERVAEAVLEVQAGVAQPEALLEWIDDLRDPEEQVATEDDNLERSFTMDFIPDTARDSATESPPGDDYMFFSANRRDGGGDDDDGGGAGGGGGGGAGEGDGDEGGGADPSDPKKPGEVAKSAAKDASVAKPSKKAAGKADKPDKPDPGTKGGGGGKKPDGK